MTGTKENEQLGQESQGGRPSDRPVLHVALFKWQPGVSPEQIRAFRAELEKLTERISLLKSFRFGSDLGLREGNFDFAVVATLSSPDDVDAYLDHPVHQKLVADHVTAMLAERKAVQLLL